MIIEITHRYCAADEVLVSNPLTVNDEPFGSNGHFDLEDLSCCTDILTTGASTDDSAVVHESKGSVIKGEVHIMLHPTYQVWYCVLLLYTV